MNIRVTLHDAMTRRSIEDAIERLLGLLDGLDADPDLEPDNDDEPGTWTEVMQSRASCTVDDENREDGGDSDPDDSGYGDLDGMIEDKTGEPSLGWTTAIDQSVSLYSSTLAVFDGEEDVGEMRQLDLAEADTVQWSSDPDIPQEGYDWHGHVAGQSASRNSETGAA